MKPYIHYTSQSGYEAMMRWYDGALASLPVAYDSHCIETCAGETHVLTAGQHDAPPILLIHGINVSALNWKAQIANLASHYRIIVPDVPGFAGRSAPVRLPYYADAYAHWLRDVMRAFGVDQAVVAGSSGGGYFALELAATYPEAAAGLVLINPCGLCRYPYPLNLGRQQWVVDWVGKLGRRLASYERAEQLVRLNATPGSQINPETVEMAYLLLKHFRRHPPPGALSNAQLAKITAPTLLLLGENEPYFNIRYMQRTAERKLVNADLRTVVVPNAGHDIHNNDQAGIVSDYFMEMIGIRQGA